MVDIRHVKIETQPDELVQLARQFATLDAEKRTLDDRLKQIQEAKEAIEARLVLAFENHEVMGAIQLRDLGLSVFVRVSRYARVDPEHLDELKAGLERHGLGHFVKPTISPQTLSAWLREMEEADAEIPPDIAPYIKDGTVFRISVRKAARR